MTDTLTHGQTDQLLNLGCAYIYIYVYTRMHACMYNNGRFIGTSHVTYTVGWSCATILTLEI